MQAPNDRLMDNLTERYCTCGTPVVVLRCASGNRRRGDPDAPLTQEVLVPDERKQPGGS